MANTKNEKLQLLEALLVKKKMRGLDDLYFFNKYILESNPERQKYIVPHVHKEWSTWYHSSGKRIKLILVPRGHFKSTFFTVGRTLQEIAKDKDSRILIANATLGNSQRFLGEIKDHIRGNEQYKQLYGDMFSKDLKWNESELEVAGRSIGVREPTVSAIGVGGNLVSQHYSLIIADDLVNDTNSANRFQANKVLDWWKKAFSLLDPEGEMIIIGTRWSYYELYSHILNDSSISGMVDSFIRGSYKKDGSVYFPEKFNDAKLTELKQLHGSYIFSAFYMNEPVDDEAAIISKSQIQYYEEGYQPSGLNIFAMCDPAISQKDMADSSSITIVGIDSDNNWWVREVRRGKWLVSELVMQLFLVYKEWHPQAMSIETIGQAQGIMSPIWQMEGQEKIYLPLTQIKARPQVTKEMRIRSVLQPRFERGKVFIKKDMYDLEEELLKFPLCDHDDIIDSLTDLEEIGYQSDDDGDKEKEETHVSKLINKLKQQGQGLDSYDPVMGEYY